LGDHELTDRARTRSIASGDSAMPIFEQNAVYLQSGNPETEDVATLLYPGQLGARFTVANPARGGRAKRYQYVKTDPAMATAPIAGGLAYWQDRANYVVTTAVGALNNLCGRFPNAITKGNYGCIQIGGPGVTKIIAGDTATVAAGDSIIGSAVNAGTK